MASPARILTESEYRIEEYLGTRLDWVAVDHFNTGHPHTHSPAARKQGRPYGKDPLADHLDFLIAAVEAKPDITMSELAVRLEAETGTAANPASISRLLCRAGFTYKKQLMASECACPKRGLHFSKCRILGRLQVRVKFLKKLNPPNLCPE